jgi:organic radical activating enzyme
MFKPIIFIFFSSKNFMLFSFFLSIDCSYCDTPGIDQAAFNLTEKDLLADIHLQLTGYPFLKLLITGGEPLACNRQEALLKPSAVKLPGATRRLTRHSSML